MKWEPKQGEMINTNIGQREFIGITTYGFYLCWNILKSDANAYDSFHCSEIKPEPIIERRWQWAKNHANGTTELRNGYISNDYVMELSIADGWYKLENNYIDVELKDLS